MAPRTVRMEAWRKGGQGVKWTPTDGGHHVDLDIGSLLMEGVLHGRYYQDYRPWKDGYRPRRNFSFCRSFVLPEPVAVDAVYVLRTFLGHQAKIVGHLEE